MNYPVWVLALLLAALGSAAAAEAGEALHAERFGLYVLADDLDRSAAFYERLFGAPPQVRTPGLVGFDVAGGLYAVASRRAYAPGTSRGDGVRPYIKVADVFAAFERVRAVAPETLQSEAVVEEGPFKFFRLRDPDGNLVEFFSFAHPARSLGR